MQSATDMKRDIDKAADIIRDAGGEIIGRTRLQKIAYLLELAGMGAGFPFEYRHYGPYSEELSLAIRKACLLGLVDEEERTASWGGIYSIYRDKLGLGYATPDRVALVQEAIHADPVELELAATAAFLSRQGSRDPWQETAKRKPDKSDGDRLKKAQALYRKLAEIRTPEPLPKIA